MIRFLNNHLDEMRLSSHITEQIGERMARLPKIRRHLDEVASPKLAHKLTEAQIPSYPSFRR